VSINDVGSKPSYGPDIAIGADGGVKPLSGLPYPAIAAVDGVSLQWGDDEVIVEDDSTYRSARGTTAQYVSIAEALMVAIHNS
jgi:hypothetical protein